jgi:hypothetical protein
MNNYAELSQLLSFSACIFPFFFPGPIAAIVFYAVSKRNNIAITILFWLGLLMVNGIASFLIIATWGHSWPGAGFFAVLASPLSAIASIIILLRAGKDYWRVAENNLPWRILYITGIILIPLLQLLVAFWAPQFVDAVCQWLYPRGLGC